MYSLADAYTHVLLRWSLLSYVLSVMSSKFVSLCAELSQLHINIIRRSGHPVLLAREGLSLVHEHIDCVETSEENKNSIPVFLRCCASMLRHAKEGAHSTRSMQILDTAYTVASQHIHDGLGNVNAASGVLRAVLALNTYEQDASPSTVAWTRSDHVYRPNARHCETHEWQQEGGGRRYGRPTRRQGGCAHRRDGTASHKPPCVM